MGQYKFSIHIDWQIGFLININPYSVDIYIMCFSMYFGRDKEAKGGDLFNRWFFN